MIFGQLANIGIELPPCHKKGQDSAQLILKLFIVQFCYLKLSKECKPFDLTQAKNVYKSTYN